MLQAYPLAEAEAVLPSFWRALAHRFTLAGRRCPAVALGSECAGPRAVQKTASRMVPVRLVVKVTGVLCALKGEVMYIESLVLQNFRCFGNQRTVIALGPGLTPFIGSNGAGKTAACQALQRLFGITTDERTVRIDDFHVPAGKPPPERVGDERRRSRGRWPSRPSSRSPNSMMTATRARTPSRSFSTGWRRMTRAR